MSRLSFCPDPAPARWLVDSETPFDQLVTFGPDGYEASARIRFIPDPTRPGQSESDAVPADDHLHDLAQTQLAVAVLAEFTDSRDDAYFCVWEGYSDVRLPAELTPASMVVLPHRRYALFRGPLSGLDAFADQFSLDGTTPVMPPAFVWPADRRWCLARDVDPHWAGLGAEAVAIESLLTESRLDVVPADPRTVQPLYY